LTASSRKASSRKASSRKASSRKAKLGSKGRARASSSRAGGRTVKVQVQQKFEITLPPPERKRST
ncbi:MAG: hypothetical protein LC647_05245, partial [Beggiatoa sp.]|nr:hypothetical protein [Beggiatoa sp.]